MPPADQHHDNSQPQDEINAFFRIEYFKTPKPGINEKYLWLF